MCYAIPGKVEELHKKTVIVSYFGETKKAINELSNLKIGDYVYAQGGYVLEIIPESEALKILDAWKDVFFELKTKDRTLSQLDPVYTEKKQLHRILNKASENSPLSDSQYQSLLSLKTTADQTLFFKTANFLRQKYQENSCCVHGIIEISNHCQRNCLYCGIRAGNTDLKRYRMNLDEILEAARQAIEIYGFRSLVLQSGEDSAYSINDLCTIVKKIISRWPVLIFISFGEIGVDGLEALYHAGARGILMRFETANPKLYEQIRPGCLFETRIRHLKKAFELNYLIITGSIVGLPNQTPNDILNDIKLAKELHAEMISIGPLIPHPQTPFADYPVCKETDILKVLAAARLMDPEQAKILVTTSFETLSPTARQKGLLAGANSVMLNVTPIQYRSLYSIYPNRAHEQESIQEQIDDTIGLLQLLGRAPTDLSVAH